MRLKLFMLVMVDDEVCSYKFMKSKLDELVIEVLEVHVVTDSHWGYPADWAGERATEWRLSLSKKERLDVKKKHWGEYYCVYQHVRRETDKAKRKRIRKMVARSDVLVLFWDKTDDNIREVRDEAVRQGIDIREYLI